MDVVCWGSDTLAILGELKAGQGVLVLHPTSFDGCVELAGLQLGFSVAGTSCIEAHHKCAQEVVKGHLLQARAAKK